MQTYDNKIKNQNKNKKTYTGQLYTNNTNNKATCNLHTDTLKIRGISNKNEYYSNLAENYENDTTRESESVKAIESLSQELNTPAEVVTDIESIADERKKRDAKKGMKGWFDPKAGKVVVVLPNVSDTQDAGETMLHEAVGHRGLRALFGKRYNDFLNQVFAYGSLYL